MRKYGSPATNKQIIIILLIVLAILAYLAVSLGRLAAHRGHRTPPPGRAAPRPALSIAPNRPSQKAVLRNNPEIQVNRNG